jgi:hypothetical protein
MDDTHHEMILEQTHISGVEEWYCPTCGRRFLVQWPPAYKMIVIEAGEKDTRHNLSRSNRRIGSLPPAQLGAAELTDEVRLIPWLKWMEKVDFDGMWGKNT